METIVNWIISNKVEIVAGYFAIVGLASWIVKLTPTIHDDNFLKRIIKFIGKFIAADKYGPNG